jgi:hypothetical protein
MKIISTKLHGVLDYLVGIILIRSPWLFGFANRGAQSAFRLFLASGQLYTVFLVSMN